MPASLAHAVISGLMGKAEHWSGKAAGLINSHGPILSLVQVSWRAVFWGLGMEFVLGIFIIRTDPGFEAFQWLGSQIQVTASITGHSQRPGGGLVIIRLAPSWVSEAKAERHNRETQMGPRRLWWQGWSFLRQVWALASQVTWLGQQWGVEVGCGNGTWRWG